MSPVRRSVSGAVLAGGLSRRIGQDKALLRLNGMTLLERSIRTLQSAVTPIVVAAGQADRYEIPGIRTIGDPLPACGPLGGVLAALEDSAADAVIILACDLPFVTTELIRLLVETEPLSSLVVPSVGPDVQPLCGCYAVSLKVPLRAYLEEGKRRVSDFASAQRHTRITITPDHPVYHPHLLSNVNTEEELLNAEVLYERDPRRLAPE